MLSPHHIAQITDTANWLDNPLAKREARRDWKRKQPAKAYAWMLGTLSILFLTAIWGLGWMRESGYGIPWYLGGSFGTALCISICGVHSWFISAAARKHTSLLLWREAQRNTLPGLLTLPTPAFQLLLQTGLYPWVAAMRLALVGLPFYLYCVASGGMSWPDLGLLYVAFGLMSLVFATWNRPILSSTAMFPVMPAQGGIGAAGMASSGPGAGQAGNAASGQSGSSQSAGWAFLVPMFVMAFLIPALARGGVRGVYSGMLRYAPDSLLQLVPTFMFSWPLLLARSLITPFDWFDWHVIPLPFLLASYAASRYLGLVRSSEYISVGTYRDLARQPTYSQRRVWEQWLRTAQMFVATGYLWKWGIEDGGFLFLAPPRIGTGTASLAAFLYVLFLTAMWRWLGRVRSVAGWRLADVRLPKKPSLVLKRMPPGAALRYLAAPLWTTAAFYFACCALSRTWPFPPPIAILAGRMLAIGGSAALLQYAFVRTLGLSPVLPGFCLVAIVSFGPPEAGALAVLSPLLGLMTLGSPSILGWIRFGAAPPAGLLALYAHTPAWWTWALACGATGAMLAVWIPLVGGRRASVSSEAIGSELESGEGRAERVTVDPTRVGPEVYYDSLFEKKDKDSKTESPVGLRLLAAASRLTDNAVATKEMRARLRGKLSPAFLRGAALVFSIVTIGLLGAPGFTAALGGGPAALLFGALPGGSAQTIGSLLALYYAMFFWLAFSAGLGIMPLAFAPEREKSTLGFLLMTPMRSGAIIRGKAVGLLISSGVASGLLAAGILALSLLFSPTLGLVTAISTWIRCMAVGLALMGTTGIFAIGVAALFPRSVSQAGCGGLLYGLLIQVPIQLLLHLSRTIGRMGGVVAGASLLDRSLFWFIFAAVCAATSLLGLLAAMFGVWRMRRRDIGFESSRQEN